LTQLNSTPSRVNLGILLSVLTFLAIAIADSIVKWLSLSYPVSEIMAFVSVFALVPAIVMVVLNRRSESLQITRVGLVAIRSLLGAVSILLGFFTLSRLPLADAYAVFFMTPLLVTALSAPLLHERVGWSSWTAVMVGFLGVLIILQPGFAVLTVGELAALATAFIYSLQLVVLRRIAGSESSTAILIAFLVALFVVGLPGAILNYRPPTSVDFCLMAGGGLVFGLNNLGLIFALRFAPAATVVPFMYTQIIWGALFGFALFGDRPERQIFVGSAVIVASGLYTFWRSDASQRRSAERA
jgi:drug/metabolite transporter (DMT)-like permease